MPPAKPVNRLLRRITLFVILYALPLNAAEEIIVRARLDRDTVWIGERVQMQIDVLGRNGWAQAKPAEEFTLPGWYILPAGNSRVRLQESIDGDDYSGQRYEYFLYPQRSGKMEIPELALQVSLQTWGAGGGTVEQIKSSPPLSLEVATPPGVDPALPLIVSPEFKAKQTWEPDTTELSIGEALQRTLILEAAHLPAMVLPPIAHPDADGMGAYPKDPVAEDRPDGSGLRRESVTYVCQSAARTELPTHSFQWWNPKTKELNRVILPGRKLLILGPTPIQDTDSPAQPFGIPRILVVTLTLTIFVYFFLRLIRRAPPAESLHFKALVRSAQNGDPSATCHALLLWFDCLPNKPENCLAFFKEHGTPNALVLTTRLLCNPQQKFTPEELRQLVCELKRARKRSRIAQRKKKEIDRHLQTLNG